MGLKYHRAWLGTVILIQRIPCCPYPEGALGWQGQVGAAVLEAEGVWFYQLFPWLGLAGAHVACSAWACLTGQPSCRAGSGLTHPWPPAQLLPSTSAQALGFNLSFSDPKTPPVESLSSSLSSRMVGVWLRRGASALWPKHSKKLLSRKCSGPLVTPAWGQEEPLCD